jgi:hypothetical protein
MDRFQSNPYVLDECTRWGALDVALMHMSINDNTLGNFTTNTAPTTIFNNAGGSASFVQGPTTYYNHLLLAFLRFRQAQPGAMIVVDVGFTDPTSTQSGTTLAAMRQAFTDAFDGDKLVVLLDMINGQYRWLGNTYTIAGMPVPVIPNGASGSSPYFGKGTATITYSITGSVLTVTVANAGDLIEGMYPPAVNCQIQSQISGTTGGIGTYQLTLAPGDVASTSALWSSDPVHPIRNGHLYWGQERGKAAVFCAQKALGLI